MTIHIEHILLGLGLTMAMYLMSNFVCVSGTWNATTGSCTSFEELVTDVCFENPHASFCQ